LKSNPAGQIAASLFGVELHDADMRVLSLSGQIVRALDSEQHREVDVHARQLVEHRLWQNRLIYACLNGSFDKLYRID